MELTETAAILKITETLLKIAPTVYNALKDSAKSIITEEEFTEFLDSYYTRVYNKIYYANILFAPNSKIPLPDIYLPLTIEKNSNSKSESNFKIASYPTKLFNLHKRILIKDSAGMGKSTLLRKIFLAAIDEIDLGNNNLPLPLLVDLRKIQQFNSLEGLIKFEFLNGDNKYEDIFDDLLISGKILFLFDGFDEVPKEAQNTSLNQIKDFTEKFHGNIFVTTSRDEPILGSLSSFQGFKICRLEIGETHELIRTCGKYINDFNSNELIKELASKENKHLLDLFSNPMLVTLLVIAYDYKKRIPWKKTDYFEQVFDALFEKHDLTKPTSFDRIKKSGLRKADFANVLRHIAIIAFTKHTGKIEFSWAEIVALIRTSKETLGLQFDVDDFHDDILNAVPLFLKDGVNFRWAHKSFQDYYAASWLSVAKHPKLEETKTGIFDAIDSNYNLVVLYSELEEFEVGERIIHPFLNKLINFCELRIKQNIEYGLEPEIAEYEAITAFFGKYYIETGSPTVRFGDKKEISMQAYVMAPNLTITGETEMKLRAIANIIFSKKLVVFKSVTPQMRALDKLNLGPGRIPIDPDFLKSQPDLDTRRSIISYILHHPKPNKIFDLNLCKQWVKDFNERISRRKSVDLFG